MLWVQCTAEDYADVAAPVRQHMQRHGAARRLPKKSPLPAYLERSLLAVVSSVPLFPLAEQFDIGLFLPIFIPCFALATVCLINLFGWAVIGGLLAQGVVVDQM